MIFAPWTSSFNYADIGAASNLVDITRELMRLYSINTFLACAFKKKLTSLICEASSPDQMESQFDVSPISSIALPKCLVYYT